MYIYINEKVSPQVCDIKMAPTRHLQSKLLKVVVYFHIMVTCMNNTEKEVLVGSVGRLVRHIQGGLNKRGRVLWLSCIIWLYRFP